MIVDFSCRTPRSLRHKRELPRVHECNRGCDVRIEGNEVLIFAARVGQMRENPGG